MTRPCMRCHICGTPVRIVLDGEEWCPRCGRYQRPASHGWGRSEGDLSPCWPEPCPACGWPAPYHDADRCRLEAR